jgi:hypothetical protein
MLISAALATLLVTTILACWNWWVASRVYEWSTDPKNTYLFIAKRLRPEILSRDFPFCDDRIFKFYQPLYLRVTVMLARWFGDIIPATRVLHFVFTFVYLLGWVLLARMLGATWLATSLFLVALIPYVPVTGADGIGVGAPGTWWSRSMANAFVPWFALLAYLHFHGVNVVLVAFALLGIVLHVHPVVAVGLLPSMIGLVAVDILFTGRFAVLETLAGFAILSLLGVMFVRSYLGASRRPSDSTVDWDQVNALAFKRFRLWPYAILPDNGSAARAGLNRFLNAAIGGGCLAAVVAIVVLFPHATPGARYYWLTAANVVVLLFLHIPPGEGSGVRLAVISAFGAVHALDLLGPGFVAGVFGLLLASRFQFRRILLVAAAAVTVGSLGWVWFDDSAWSVAAGRSVTLFEWWLAASIPAVFAWYLAGSFVTLDLLPIRLHRPLTIIDWGRTAKIAQLPMYCFVLWLAIDVSDRLGPGVFDYWSATLAGLLLSITLVNPRTAYRRHLDPADRGLFEWAGTTSEDALFHVVSGDIWFSFDFRANCLRAITGSWKDGGICHYSDVKRFFEWDSRMRLITDGIKSGRTSIVAEQGARFGADYVVIDRRLGLAESVEEEPVFENPRWQVRALAPRAKFAPHVASFGAAPVV